METIKLFSSLAWKEFVSICTLVYAKNLEMLGEMAQWERALPGKCEELRLNPHSPCERARSGDTCPSIIPTRGQRQEDPRSLLAARPSQKD